MSSSSHERVTAGQPGYRDIARALYEAIPILIALLQSSEGEKGPINYSDLVKCSSCSSMAIARHALG
eukprot:15481676-Alexandrium_andersonii.AAC.1